MRYGVSADTGKVIVLARFFDNRAWLNRLNAIGTNILQFFEINETRFGKQR